MALVPCLNPGAHHVSNHVQGSAEEISCRALSQRPASRLPPVPPSPYESNEALQMLQNRSRAAGFIDSGSIVLDDDGFTFIAIVDESFDYHGFPVQEGAEVRFTKYGDIESIEGVSYPEGLHYLAISEAVRLAESDLDYAGHIDLSALKPGVSVLDPTQVKARDDFYIGGVEIKAGTTILVANNYQPKPQVPEFMIPEPDEQPGPNTPLNGFRYQSYFDGPPDFNDPRVVMRTLNRATRSGELNVTRSGSRYRFATADGSHSSFVANIDPDSLANNAAFRKFLNKLPRKTLFTRDAPKVESEPLSHAAVDKALQEDSEIVTTSDTRGNGCVQVLTMTGERWDLRFENGQLTQRPDDFDRWWQERSPGPTNESHSSGRQ